MPFNIVTLCLYIGFYKIKGGKDIVFSYITNIKLTRRNVERLFRIGRSPWKIENETFNTLKH